MRWPGGQRSAIWRRSCDLAAFSLMTVTMLSATLVRMGDTNRSTSSSIPPESFLTFALASSSSLCRARTWLTIARFFESRSAMRADLRSKMDPTRCIPGVCPRSLSLSLSIWPMPSKICSACSSRDSATVLMLLEMALEVSLHPFSTFFRAFSSVMVLLRVVSHSRLANSTALFFSFSFLISAR